MDENHLLTSLSLADQENRQIPSPPGIKPIYAVAMPEERSFDRWQESDRKAREFGYRAIGIGSEDSLERLMESSEFAEAVNTEEARKAVRDFDLPKWLGEREKELELEGGEIPHGNWEDPEGPASPGLWFPFEDGVHLDPWWMGLVPAEEHWEIPLSLGYGNWNDCPDPLVHGALALHWERKFGANIVAIGSDTVEFLVQRPPKNRDEALTLAKEHYFYCTDIVEQGIGTIAALGASLIENGTWSFWWD